MSHSASLFRWVFLVVCAACAHASRADPSAADQLDRYLRIQSDLGHFTGTALIAKDDEVLLHAAFGMANLEDRTACDTRTQFRAASVTKQFTAALSLLAERRGLLAVRDPIRKHLPQAPDSWADIRIEHLIRHTSGIPDYEESLGLGSAAYDEFMGKPDVPERIFRWAAERPLDFAPGTKFHYSNSAYVVLGMVLEAATKQSLKDLLRTEIAMPLGMNSTQMETHTDPPPRLARGYRIKPEPDRLHYYAGLDLARLGSLAAEMRMTPPQGDAGLVTSAEDLFVWTRTLRGGSFWSDAERARLLDPADGEYAYGLFVQQGPKGRDIEHIGELPGYRSIVRVTGDGYTIILLCNSELFLGRIADELLALARGESINWPTRYRFQDVGRDKLQQLVGTYTDPRGRAVDAVLSPDGLTVGEKGRFTALLLSCSETEFFAPMFGGPVRFERDPAGAGSSLTIVVKSVDWKLKRRP